MQMLNQKKRINRIIKKSHLLVFGSLLAFLGVGILSFNHILRIKNIVYSDMMLMISDSIMGNEVIENIPNVEELPSNSGDSNQSQIPPSSSGDGKVEPPPIDYSKYLGVLEIPRISLKRGFYNTDSRYNNIEYNVTLVAGSTMPDVSRGNLILMAHSGDAYISFFAYLYKLGIGDNIYVTYNNVKYHYKLVNIYNVLKDGNVTIVRNYDHTTLTLITCTKDSSNEQTVYIAEMV